MSNNNTALEFFKQNGNSKIQEQFAEYHFLKDLLLEAAVNNEKIDIARSDIDAFGFDLFLSRQKEGSFKTLNVQLKATSGKCRNWDVHKSLLEVENGRVILVKFAVNATIIEAKYFMFENRHSKDALNTAPRVNKSHKCKTKFGQFIEVTDNLMQIF